MKLIKQTKFLIAECDASRDRFFKMRELDATPQFFEEVKPHADKVHILLLEWKEQAYQWIRKHQPKYFHVQQVDNVVDAMDQFVVQSFYKETSKKRFIQSVQSVHYTLSTFLKYLEERNSE
ncbi:MAG: YppE family protein [Lysinibacillus sp.]|nr:YppE family protein [Lysinibacillus sp.]